MYLSSYSIDQVTLWHGNNSTQYANTPNGYDYYYQVPDLYTSVQQVGLNWMGAKWVNNNQMNYTAYVTYISATNQCKINVNPYGSITFYYISFSVVILSVQSSSYLQLYNESNQFLSTIQHYYQSGSINELMQLVINILQAQQVVHLFSLMLLTIQL